MKSVRVLGWTAIAAVALAVVSAVIHDRVMRGRVEMWRTLAQEEAVVNLAAQLGGAERIALSEPFGVYLMPGPIEWERMLRWDWSPVRIPERQIIVILTNQAMTSVDGVVLVGSTTHQVVPIRVEIEHDIMRYRLGVRVGKDAAGQVAVSCECACPVLPSTITSEPPDQ